MFGFFKKKKGKKGLVGIAVTGQGVAFAHITQEKESPLLNSCELIPADDDKDGVAKLAGKVSELNLEATRCSYVLSSADYKLLLVDAPEVEPDEMAAAVKWRIKDLIDQPIDDVAIDVFPVPADAYRSKGDRVYVVAAQKSKIINIVKTIEDAGLTLETIDIPELAMKNLSSFLADDSNGLAFMDLRGSGSTMNLCKNGAIYLTRHLNTQADQEIMGSYEWADVKERLILEIQRSLDYYESQMGQIQLSTLLIAPRKQDSEALASQLSAAMAVRVETMDIASKLDMRTDLELPAAIQQSCMMAIGAALRTEVAA